MSAEPEEPSVERKDTAEGDQAAAFVHEPDAERLGRGAASPVQIPWPGWKAVVRRTFREAISDRVSLTAAGCAFWATLSLFPAITMADLSLRPRVRPGDRGAAA